VTRLSPDSILIVPEQTGYRRRLANRQRYKPGPYHRSSAATAAEGQGESHGEGRGALRCTQKGASSSRTACLAAQRLGVKAYGGQVVERGRDPRSVSAGTSLHPRHRLGRGGDDNAFRAGRLDREFLAVRVGPGHMVRPPSLMSSGSPGTAGHTLSCPAPGPPFLCENDESQWAEFRRPGHTLRCMAGHGGNGCASIQPGRSSQAAGAPDGVNGGRGGDVIPRGGCHLGHPA